MKYKYQFKTPRSVKAVKKTHGGKRKGAGRKPGITFKEPTVVMRVPKSLVPTVKKLIKKKSG